MVSETSRCLQQNRDRSMTVLISIKISTCLLWALLLLSFMPKAMASETQPAETMNASINDCVILLHGLGRTADSMNDMAEALEIGGYQTVNLDYPSREFPIQKLAMQTIPQGIRACRIKGTKKIHFVTHSMGGILLRYYMTQAEIQDLGRVVMLSPPNQGSEAADELKSNAFYKWYNGPAGQQLGTKPDGFVFTLGPATFPLGIITGNEHALFDGWLSGKIPGEDDGKVAVERARLEGMTDFLVLPFAHTFIMRENTVIQQTLHFLRYERFLSLSEVKP
jgi:pimeloyl-ACP methyl ester carboxylesterase